MKQAIAGAVLAALPSLAYGQTQVQVPAIEAGAPPQMSASASSTAVASINLGNAAPAPSDHGSAVRVAHDVSDALPGTMPPPIPLISPAVTPLNAKEQRAVALARRWKNRAEMPQAGEDGVVRFLYGATLPTVVCAPLQVCNVALQPGEIVNNLNLGDAVRWKISPSISGGGGNQTTHLIIKPTDAGLLTSLDIETNRRTYAIKLVSTVAEWMPLVAFNYPDDTQAQWQNYRQAVAFGAAATTLPTGESVANLTFLCLNPATGGPSWAPTRAYTDGMKTYIEFPTSITYQAAPALVALANDGGWFSSATPQLVNYRVQGNRYVVDAALDRAALIAGVGGDQQRVTITRGGGCR